MPPVPLDARHPREQYAARRTDAALAVFSPETVPEFAPKFLAPAPFRVLREADSNKLHRAKIPYEGWY
jgi:hypothetical protein